MTVITHTLEDADGNALANTQVTVRLLPRPAFETASGVELSPLVRTTTDSAGLWSLDLVETADITPADSFYEVTHHIPDSRGGATKFIFQVGASPATLYASLVDVPPVSDINTYLTQEAGDARYVQSPGSFASSVTDSRPNDAATSGVDTTYSRGDHTHEREDTYGTASARAALTGNDLFEGLRFRETDGTDKLYEYRGSTWLQRQDTLVVADATARDAIANPYIGMRVILADNGLRQWYDGSGWYLEGEQLLARTVLGSGATSVSSGTLPVVPNAGSLRIEWKAQHASTTGRNVSLRFNSDSGANYWRQYLFANDATITADATATVNETAIAIGSVGNESSNRWSFGIAEVNDYRSAHHKSVMARSTDPRAISAPLLLHIIGLWASTSAITSVSIVEPAGGNFATGSTLSVFARSTKG